MQPTKEPFAYIRDEIVPLSQAFLHISDLAVQRGYGIFDYFKINNGHPFFLDHYLDRFYRSAQIMELPVPIQRDTLKTIIYDLIKRNNLEQSGIKMILTGGYSPDGYKPATPNLVISQHALALPTQAQLNEGIKIITHAYVREIPSAKTLNYTMGIRLINKIKEQGADDVLYHYKGVVSEFPRSNFFIVQPDNTVVTPALDVLPGITRQNVLSLAGQHYNIKEGTVTVDDIYQAKEAFMTSTTKRILPIVQIDNKPVGNGKPGSVTLSLLNDLIALEEKEKVSAF